MFSSHILACFDHPRYSFLPAPPVRCFPLSRALISPHYSHILVFPNHFFRSSTRLFSVYETAVTDSAPYSSQDWPVDNEIVQSEDYHSRLPASTNHLQSHEQVYSLIDEGNTTSSSALADQEPTLRAAAAQRRKTLFTDEKPARLAHTSTQATTPLKKKRPTNDATVPKRMDEDVRGIGMEIEGAVQKETPI